MPKVSLALGPAQGRGDFESLKTFMDSKAMEDLAITGILPFISLSRASDYFICGQYVHAANKC